MILESAALVPVLSKLISLGLSTWKAREDSDLTVEGAKAVQALLDAGGAVGALFRKDPSAAPVAVRHFALVTRAFGEAFRRHWYDDLHLAPRGGLRARLTESPEGKRRGAQIERRTVIAASQLMIVGDRPAEEELALVTALVGDPMNTPYYRRLWEAYTDPSHAEEGEEPLIMPGEGYRQFERHFRLAYAEGLAAPPGEPIRRYLMGLETDRVELVRALAIRDMAGWGGRHVFGTAGEESGLPPMPLGTMYVQPNAKLGKKGGEAETRPVLDFVRSLIEQHRVVVVQAHFGHGKSLSARTLAWRWAEARIAEASPSPDLWLPIVVKCAEDFGSHGDDLDRVVQRALWRHASALGLELSSDDSAFAMPPPGWKTVVLLDGLDEVAFGSRDLEALFRRMRERASEHRRFVVFSRPEMLPSAEHLKDIPVLDLQPFTTTDGSGKPGGQVAAWIERWNLVTRRRSTITMKGLVERRLLEIASTPILLLMIASIWDQLASTTEPPTHAAIYEGFFKQIARGKHQADTDQHRPIAEASERLCRALIDRGDLPEKAEPPDAMLWVLSRVAWEAKRLEEAEFLGKPKRALRNRDIENILCDELEIEDTPEIGRTVYMGVLLALQADLAQGEPRILFGHKSFREFLIGRYWERRLRQIVGAKEKQRATLEESLLGGTLLAPEDRSFAFLVEVLRAWSEPELQRLFQWAENCFNDERPHSGALSFRHDPRARLREAALAIGSSLGEDRAIRAENPQTLRSMLAWFWVHPSASATIIAPRFVSPGAYLSGADLSGADLRGAHLSEANLRGADLREAHLIGAHLGGAHLGGAHLSGAHLGGAHLGGAGLFGADLSEAHLSGADLRGAHLGGANLNGAHLRGANLRRADLFGADLRGADLRGADLRGADLRGAKLRGANVERLRATEEQREAVAEAGADAAMLEKIEWIVSARSEPS